MIGAADRHATRRGRGARSRSPSARTRGGSPSRALPEPSGSGTSPPGNGSESRSRSGSADVSAAIFAEDGRTLIASDEAGSVSVVDVRNADDWSARRSRSATKSPTRSLSAPTDAWWPQRRSTGRSSCGTRRRDTPYGSPLTADTSPVSDVAFSPDGRTLVSAHQRSAVVWDMSGEPGARRADWTEGSIRTTDVSFSPDGTRLVAGPARRRRGRVRHGDATTGASGSTATRSSRAVAVHPDGKRVAVGTIDGRVRLFDPRAARRSALPLDVGKAAVWQVAFSPDGRLLAVAVDPNGGGDGFYAQKRQGEVQLWDVASRRPVGRSDRARRRIGARRGLQPRTARCSRRAARGRLDLWDVATQAHHGQAHEGRGRRRPERRVRSERPARRRRRCDRPGPRLARLGSAPGIPSAHRAYRLRSPARRSTVPARSSRPRPLRRDQAVGSATGPRLRRRAGRKPEAGSDLDAVHRPSRSWGCGTRSARMASCWPSRASNARRCSGTSIPRVWRQRACAIVGRNLSREEWELYLPAGTAVSGDVLRSGPAAESARPAGPLPNGQKLFL